ncbi:protein of unknown function (plasmid) [Paraburkholderia dioscoreae]|uniref:Uncharacterized protein n=1 Tax=Paraburkholderia dioscoreae TaxID=2604047 RepID=A0A5Q4ZED5_9BURK|nr:protein of unknown function [Paraburkholderia dioscoreae]
MKIPFIYLSSYDRIFTLINGLAQLHMAYRQLGLKAEWSDRHVKRWCNRHFRRNVERGFGGVIDT